MISIKFIRGGQPRAYADTTYEYKVVSDESYESVLKEVQKIYDRPDGRTCNKRDASEYFAGWWDLHPTNDGFHAIFTRPYAD